MQGITVELWYNSYSHILKEKKFVKVEFLFFFNLLKSDQGVWYNVRLQSIEKHIDRHLITILLFQNFAFICWTELYHV